MSEPQTPLIEAAQFEELVRSTIPLSLGLPFHVERLGWGEAVIRLSFDPAQLRAGGTINGPAMMTLSDLALYAAVLTRIGLQPLAVTSDLHFHFLRRPPPADLIATARLLRLGRRLAVGTVEIHGGDGSVHVAHSSGSYALP